MIFSNAAYTAPDSLWMRLLATLLVLASMVTPAYGQKCRPPVNLLKGADFATAGGAGPWMARQHARSGSFAVSVDAGVLSIDKVGSEPWFTLTQNVARGGLSGRTVRYEVDLKLDVTEPSHAHGFPYEAGLFFGAKSRLNRYLLRSVAEHEPNFGESDWQRIVLEFELPPKVSQLEAGFFHQAGGTLYARDPVLYIVLPNTCVASLDNSTDSE